MKTIAARYLSVMFFVSLCLTLVSCGGGSSDGNEINGGGAPPLSKSFTYTIDPQIKPNPDTLGGKPLSAVQDEEGKASFFISNEVLINTQDEAELNAFLSRTGGTVIGDDSVPDPPPGSNITLDPTAKIPTQYLVKVDPTGFHLEGFQSDVEKLGRGGAAKISDENGARLLALITREKVVGLKVSPNFVGEGSLLEATQEHPSGGGSFNAFAWSRFGTTGSKSNVTQAWQLVDAKPDFTPVRVAIIDGGFWLDSTGRSISSLTAPAWASDFPEFPLQYDFEEDDYIADGTNPSRCTGGFECPWHGDGSASVATGRLNNQYGAAGTGGQVSEPMLFKTSLTWDKVSRAIRTAVSWGAEVISMSFGGECDNIFCDFYFEFNLYPALRNARDNNVVSVAAAGNNGWNTNSVPCKGDAVICVGALESDSNTAIGYSNFGRIVEIWAPTDIPVQPNGQTTPNLANHNGTSASAPFVAGVVAIIKAYSPGMSSDTVLDLLRNTAWRDSSDPKVTHYINAYAAVQGVTRGFNAPPAVSPSVLTGTTTVDLNRGFNVLANPRDLEDGNPCCTVTWDPAPATTTSHGREAVFIFNTTGTKTITATAADSRGLTARSTITVNVVNSPPVVSIQQPTPGSRVPQGQRLQLLGLATDRNEGPGPEDGILECSRLRWTSSNTGDAALPIVGCDVGVTFSSTGTRTLTLAATDPQGLTGSHRVDITVTAPPTNFPPTITVGSLPPVNYNGDGYAWDLLFSVSADATDPEGNTPISYTWKATSFRPNGGVVYAADVVIAGPGTNANLNWTPSDNPTLLGDFTVFGNSCYDGQIVRITLEATDSLGNKSTRTLRDVKVYRCILI